MTSAAHDPARFLSFLTGSQEERDRADTAAPRDGLLALCRDGDWEQHRQGWLSYWHPDGRNEHCRNSDVIATLDLRALLEERERMRKALEELSTYSSENCLGRMRERFAIVWGRRAGKTEWAIAEALMRPVWKIACAALNPKAQEPGT